MTDEKIEQPDSAKIKPSHVTCPNCKLAHFRREPECTRCGTVLDWPALPKVEKKK
jgi:uncharacterized paraquat-inducible protein A